MNLYMETERYMEDAIRMGELLHLPVIRNAAQVFWQAPVLKFSDEGIFLVHMGMELGGCLTDMIPRLRPANLNRELLVKAAKGGRGRKMIAIDATAGMGEDALLLAASGFQVRMYEKDPVIALLLRDSLRRGKQHPELQDILERMTLFETDSIEALNQMTESPDVVLLDPMFPERQKSALVKKKFQLLHFLEQPCAEEKELLNAAIRVKPRKIIIKRPLKGPFLDGRKPSYSLTGKAIRYDVLVLPAPVNE